MSKRRNPDLDRNHEKQFDSYLSRFRRRYKLRIIATAVAAVIFSVLSLSLLTVIFRDTLADSNWLYYPARVLLLLLPVILFIALLWRPYQQFKKSAGITELETAVPAFDGRVDTYLDMKRRNDRSPFIGLLAKDAVRKAKTAPLKKVLPTSEMAGPVFASVGMLALAGWMFTSIPLDWRASIKQLWLGWFVSDILPERSIAVAPGDTKIRIGDSLFVSATLDGFESGLAELHVKRQYTDDAGNVISDSGDPEWETVDMNLESDGSFSFTLYGLSDPIDYYVSSAFTQSEQSHVEVVVPAKITSIEHEFVYPDWTGLPPTKTDDATDINVVEGTRVTITFNTDKPLQQPELLHNEIAAGATTVSELQYQANIVVTQDGDYQLLELQDGNQIPLSPKYQISVIDDVQPTIAFDRPGSDWSATPIEEVLVGVSATDDFAVESVTLHYSVNGAEWEQITLDEENNFEHLFMLEEFLSEKGGPLIAGDLVSYYAEAKDREQSVSTDMLFIDVRPFERRFTQSQQSGGGGGGEGQQEQEISQRQKEILVSTFNLIRDAKKKEATLIDPKDTATLLSDLQNTLADQADTLAQRAEARQLLNNDPDIARFVEYMSEATNSMRPSAQSLELHTYEEAVKHQQRALQYLKRAESVFNDITINRNQDGGGGGGGAGRDMAEMYELEMDLAKNQYETPDSVPENSNQQSANDDAFDKLKELARRQQQLAEAAANKDELSEAERWQQEKLRRDLEELQRELEQLQREQTQTAQNQQGQQSQGQQGQDGSQQSSSGQSSGSQSSGDNSQNDSTQQAMQNLEEAIEELRNSEQNLAELTPEERRQALQNASEKLRQSLEQTAEARQQELQQQIADAADAVRDLNQEQQVTSSQLREALQRALDARKEDRYESGLDSLQEHQLAEQKRDMQQQLESIRQQLEDTSKRYENQAPLTTERLQQALTELERNQTSELLGISGDMIEEGLAPQAALREERISEALQNLQTDLFESSGLAAAETGTDDEAELTAADATRALQQLREALTDALARAGQSGADQPGEPGQNAQTARLERGTEGNSAGDTQAQAEENSGQGSENGSENGSESGSGDSQSNSQSDGQGDGQSNGQGNSEGNPQAQGNQGSNSSRRLGNGGTSLAFGPNDGSYDNREIPINDGQAQLIEDSINQIQQLAGGTIEELSEQSQRDLNELARELQTDNDEENNRRIEANVRLLLKQLEQLELQIYTDQRTTETTRSGRRVDDPEGFDRRAADYFRRLSETAGS